MNNTKKDIILSLICGELAAWFLIFIIKNPYIEELRALAQIGILMWSLPVIFPIIFVLGTVIGQFLSRFIKVFFQIAKFAEVGLLNTFMDWGILNLLVWATAITAGGKLTPLNSISFFCAAINSYYWNKLWTFKKAGQTTGKEFLQFLIVSIIGWLMNTGIVVIGTSLNPLFVLSAGGWLIVMKATATLVSMIWNFIGYKLIVFKV